MEIIDKEHSVGNGVFVVADPLSLLGKATTTYSTDHIVSIRLGKSYLVFWMSAALACVAIYFAFTGLKGPAYFSGAVSLMVLAAGFFYSPMALTINFANSERYRVFRWEIGFMQDIKDALDEEIARTHIAHQNAETTTHKKTLDQTLSDIESCRAAE